MKALTTEEFIKKAKEIHHGKYDYSKTTYKNSRTKVCIICPKHGEFWQEPANHLSGKGCYLCGREESGKKQVMSIEQFISKSKKVHGDKYDYSKVKYGNNYKEKIFYQHKIIVRYFIFHIKNIMKLKIILLLF